MIITLENFPVYLPGAYGNKRRPTPGLNAFTLKSTVFDRAYSTQCDALATFAQLWNSLRKASETWTLITDDESLSPPDGFAQAFCTTSELFFASDDAILELEERCPGSRFWIHFQHWELSQLDSWIELPQIQTRIRALLGLSGETPDPEEVDLLYQAEIQLPWWVRFDDPDLAATRCRSLVGPDDFQAILDAQNPDAVFHDFLEILDPPRFAVVTDSWFLTGLDTPADAPAEDFEDPIPPELYFKPHDWWEQNDVAARCPTELEELLALHVSGRSLLHVTR